MIISIFLMIFTAYFITIILVQSKILDKPRNLLIKYTTIKFISNTHFLDCRFCSGFWVSLGVALYHNQIEMFPLIAGASYFLVKLERR